MVHASPESTGTFRNMALRLGRVVVMSPHLDDAVMSLGATMFTAVESGASVEVLTVYGSGPTSTNPAGPWDSKSGFATEGEAAIARREEDRAACEILGVTPRWLGFGAEPYDRRGSMDDIKQAIRASVDGADCVLIPGFPLNHADHVEMTQLVLGMQLPCRVGLYGEQPYMYYERKRLDPAMRATAVEARVGHIEWSRVPTERAARRLKIRAVRCYKSQLRQLGLSHIGLYRMLWHEAALGGEAVAWLN